MFVILTIGALVIVVAMLGVSMCRVAALSDRNNDFALTDWIAMSGLADRQTAPTDRVGEQFLFDPPGEAFRAAG